MNNNCCMFMNVFSIDVSSSAFVHLFQFCILQSQINSLWLLWFFLFCWIVESSNSALHSCPGVNLTRLLAALWLLRVTFLFGKSLLVEVYRSTVPSRRIESSTKLLYIHAEGHFEETLLFYCFAVESFSKNESNE